MKKMLNFLLLSLIIFVNPVWADTTIAVPDFELLNLSLKLSDPQKVAEIDAQEQQKLRDIEQLLRKGLSNKAGFTMVNISTEAKNAADKSIGYLFDCAQCASKLGHEHDADYILIGRLHKPTYLFSYLIVRVFDTHENKLVKEFRSEIKGDPKVAIPGAVGNLVNKIDKILPH